MEPSEAPPQVRRTLPPALLAVGAIALVVVALLAYALAARPAAPPAVGDPVPSFYLTALDGNAISLQDLQGQVVVVNFFASWCAPCRLEAPDLEQTWREYRSRGVQFVGIAYKNASSQAEAFVREFDVTYPSAVDPGNRTAKAYGITGVPETFVVDRSGLLARHFPGGVSSADLSLVLEPLLEP